MQNWIEPIKETIKKYKALRHFILTGEFDNILTTTCVLCKEARKTNPDICQSKCNNCIYNQLYGKSCIFSKDYKIVYDLDNDDLWHFGDLINQIIESTLLFYISEILELTTKYLLLQKIESRIEFLNNMLEKVKK